MKMKEFTGYCYDDYAAEMGYKRIKNAYHKLIGTDVLLSFGLGRYGCNQCVRPVMGIAPLYGNLMWEKEFEGSFDSRGAYYNHTGIWMDTYQSAKDSMEETEKLRAYLRDIFEQAQQPFLLVAKDLQTAYDAYNARFNYICNGNMPEYSVEKNNISFLLVLKKYDETLRNFDLWVADRSEPLPETSRYAQLRRQLQEKNYDAIQNYLEEVKKENIKKLRQEKLLPGCVEGTVLLTHFKERK